MCAWKRESTGRTERLGASSPYSSAHSRPIQTTHDSFVSGNTHVNLSSNESGTDNPSHIAPTPITKEGRVYVGNLPWQASNEELKQYMQSVGEVLACNIMKNFEGRSK